MSMTDYNVVVVGTDGSRLAEPTVTRAAWLAKREDADLVIVCAYSALSRRAEAKNVATLGGDSDTIGAIAGAIGGAVHGAWPTSAVETVLAANDLDLLPVVYGLLELRAPGPAVMPA